MKCFWKWCTLKFSKIKMLIDSLSIGAATLCQLKCLREKETSKNQFYIFHWVSGWEKDWNPISPKGRLAKHDLTARSACKRMRLICLSSCHVVSQASSIIESIRASHTNVTVWSIPTAGTVFFWFWKRKKKSLHEITCHCNVWLPASVALKTTKEKCGRILATKMNNKIHYIILYE